MQIAPLGRRPSLVLNIGYQQGITFDSHRWDSEFTRPRRSQGNSSFAIRTDQWRPPRRGHGSAPCRHYASGSLGNATCRGGSGFDLQIRDAPRGERLYWKPRKLAIPHWQVARVSIATRATPPKSPLPCAFCASIARVGSSEANVFKSELSKNNHSFEFLHHTRSFEFSHNTAILLSAIGQTLASFWKTSAIES